MSDTDFVCGVCGKHYKTKRNYDKHKLLHEEGAVKVESKPKVVLNCSYCGKEYKTKRFLTKHELTHIQTAAGNEVLPVENVINPLAEDLVDESDFWPELAYVGDGDNDGQVVVFFEEEDEEQEALLLSELLGVPHENPQPKDVPKNQPKTPLALCSYCGQGYQTIERYILHLMSHSVEDALTKAPSLEELIGQSERLCIEILHDIMLSYKDGTSRLEKQLIFCSSKMLDNISTEYSTAFIESLTGALYACFALGNKFVLPSHLREVYMKGSAILMANKEKKEDLHVKLLSAIDSEECDRDINFFLTTFMRKFSLKVLAYIFHWLVNGEDSPIQLSEKKYIKIKQNLDTVDFKQTLHYTAGSNVKSVLRNAWRKWRGHDEGQAVIKTIRENFLIDDGDAAKAAPDEEFMEWTLAQDRGKLIKINDLALNFFFELATIVKCLEHFDGSLYVDEVIQKFSSHPKILFLWEELVKETLPKQLQFRLLHSLCTYFCNTWRSGIISRRMDEMQSRKQAQTLGTSGVNFRSKVVKFNQR